MTFYVKPYNYTTGIYTNGMSTCIVTQIYFLKNFLHIL